MAERIERRNIEIDPAVLSILGEGERRKEERALTPQQRKQRAYDAARRKVTLDFARAHGLEEAVRKAAAREDCGLSSYTLWLIRLGLERVQRENLTPEKQIARSLKYSYEAIV